MSFRQWFIAFLEEKGLMGKTYEVEHRGITHYINTDVIIEYICSCPQNIKDNIKAKIVYLDFRNADIDDFIKHLATGMVEVKCKY